MNGIIVPKQYRHQLRAERDDDQRKLDIKKLICEAEGKPLTGAQFIEATGVTSANLHVKRLMKEGYITRAPFKHGGTGRKYAYRWHNIPLEPRAAAMRNGETVLTRTILMPAKQVSKDHQSILTAAFHTWIDEAEPTGDEIVAVRSFRKWVAQTENRIDEERTAALEKEAGK